ncbi:MAG: UDP-N-acetylglucosamine 2-epimerase (hydrolyzing) [Deltaproteobacteria bacterium]|nr:UDP-N-acetylglucosamine 2-epimerase (hydrolyzing) [Deltaproteobacteria bacterium]
MRNILLITGSRGEYGYIRPIVREIEKAPDLDYSLVVTNLHLLTEFGRSVEEIEKDGLEIAERLFMALDGYTPASMSKSLGIFLMGITDVLSRMKPDIVLLAGDRGEQLMTAIAAGHMNIPIAHIQAGELSGNIDGMSRHAITRFAHIHFASSEDAAQRLRRMGEQDSRIHLTGAPQLDELHRGDYAPLDEITGLFRLDPKVPFVLFVQHPVTEEYDSTARQVEETLEAICEIGVPTVAIFPNNDAGSAELRRVLERYRRPFIKIERNLSRRIYLGLLHSASAMVGNSSSGLIEAPCFRLPAVNVGTRQRGRERGSNVIDVEAEKSAIRRALERALSADFRTKLDADCRNPYLGDGNVSQRIVEILRTVLIDEDLLKKQIAY